MPAATYDSRMPDPAGPTIPTPRPNPDAVRDIASETRQIGTRKIVKITRTDPVAGETFDAFHEVPANPLPPRAPAPTLFHHPRSPARRFAELGNAIRWGMARRLKPDPVADEIAALRAAKFDRMADLLEKQQTPKEAPPRDPEIRFDLPDEVRVSDSINRFFRLTSDEVKEICERHQKGELGVWGRIEDVEITDDIVFCPALAGPAAESAVSVAQGVGLVRSRWTSYFRRDQVEAGASRRVNGQRETDGRSGETYDHPSSHWIEVATLLGGGGNAVGCHVYSQLDPNAAL